MQTKAEVSVLVPAQRCAAPAIHNAIRNAVGVSINELPMTPVRVLDALRKARAEQ